MLHHSGIRIWILVKSWKHRKCIYEGEDFICKQSDSKIISDWNAVAKDICRWRWSYILIIYRKCHVAIPDICHESQENSRVNFFWPVYIFKDLTRKLAIYCVFCRNNAKNWQFSVYFVVIYAFFWCKFYSPKILPV